jgi:protocatechuate 3,4-dioxygenase beta subunit
MDRRGFMRTAGGLLVAGIAPRALAGNEEGMAVPSKACEATRQITPGPFLKSGSPLRSDLREGLPGTPLKLRLSVLDSIWCKPVEGAVVDVWQCDALGRYSGSENLNFDLTTLRVTGVGLDLRDKSFLRGHQITGKDGIVEFTTIFPGWYIPRLPHIHVRVTFGEVGWTTESTQLFFPAELSSAVYESGVYAERGPNPIDIDRDLVLKGNRQKMEELTVAIDKQGEGFVAGYEIAMTAL